MRQFNITPITGSIAAPFNKDAFSHLTAMNKELADSYVKSLFPEGIFQSSRNPICILQGARVTFPGSLPGNGSVTAGYAWYNGEFYLIDAQATISIASGQTLYWTVETTYDGSYASVTFSDGITRDFYQIKKLKLVAGTSGGGIKDYDDQDEVVYLNYPFTVTFQNSATNGGANLYVRQNGRYLLISGEISRSGGFSSGTVYFTLNKRNCLAEILNASINKDFIQCTAMNVSSGAPYAVRGILQYNSGSGNIEFTLSAAQSHTSIGINAVIELWDGLV